MKISTLTLVMLGILSCVPSMTWASSFDCRKAAAPTDFVICSDIPLQDANDKLADAWRSLRARLRPEERKALVQEQTVWMRALATQCGVPEHGHPPNEVTSEEKACVLAGLEERTTQLAGLVSRSGNNGEVGCDHQLSVAELGRLRELVKMRPGAHLSDFSDESGKVNFVCRDARSQPDSFVFRPPEVCTACGFIYTVYRNAGKDVLIESSNTGGNNADNKENVVFDLSENPYALLLKIYAHQGYSQVAYELIGIDDGEWLGLSGVSNDMEGCDAEDEVTLDELAPPLKIRRRDGHYDILFEISSRDCKTGEITKEIESYSPTSRGFKRQE